MNTKNNTFDLHLISENNHIIDHTFSSYFLNDEENHIDYLPNTNNLNIFIGSNNSGKSRFMRELIKMENYYLSQNLYPNIESYNKIILDIFNRYNNVNNYRKENFLLEFSQDNINKLKHQLDGLNTKLPNLRILPEYRDLIENIKKNKSYYRNL